MASIDLQKAINTVSWPYLFDVVRRWGFSPNIHSLYSSLSAQIRLMGHYSDGSNIHKGTRQGCPLSPLIFAIIIESLAVAIRSNLDIKGVLCGPQDQQVDQLKRHFPFPWAKDTILYRGITLSSRVGRLFAENYPQMFEKLERDLRAWSKCGLSWLGRVNAVKMTLMPCILYLFPCPCQKLN